ncbi:MAG: VOC family protein [Actinomycetota bacterium]
MPSVTRYRNGVPSWADVGLPDVAAGAAFYSSLFGWEAADQGPEAGHYTMFSLDGASVAAAGPNAQVPDADDVPPSWTAYVSVDDLDTTLGKVEPAGGRVLMPRMDIFTSGSMAMIQDPTGAVLSLWQPGDHIGAERVNEPNTLAWHELNTRDPEAAMAFHAAVFGWEFEELNGDAVDGPGAGYRLVRIGERMVAGILPMEGDDWGDMPSHWMIYFAVDDCDATVARAKELGAAVGVEPIDIAIGRFAVLSDPQGAHFSVMSFAGPMDEIPDGVA